MHLVLLPPDGGQVSRSRKRRKPSTLILTEAETRQLRIVLRNLHGQYGTWGCLASVMEVGRCVLIAVASGKRRGSPGLLLRAARAAGLPLERILSTSLSIANTCSTCGRST